ncbi:hypothetical protein B0H13DRAFT_1892798 [Mycena leptocephala]|nr:hypothetical protein B0H13DRAFT_1892798 [Mycena leptocephala]
MDDEMLHEEEDRLKHKAIPSHSKTGSTQGDSKSYQDWLKHKWNPSPYRLAQAQGNSSLVINGNIKIHPKLRVFSACDPVSDLGKPTKVQRIPTVYQMSCVQLKGRKIECLSVALISAAFRYFPFLTMSRSWCLTCRGKADDDDFDPMKFPATNAMFTPDGARVPVPAPADGDRRGSLRRAATAARRLAPSAGLFGLGLSPPPAPWESIAGQHSDEPRP